MNKVVVAVSSLCAEGTPVLALELLRRWRQQGVHAELFVLSRERPDLEAELLALGVRPHFAELGAGRGRFVRMARAMASFVAARGATSLLSFPLGWHAFLGYGARWGGAERVVAHVGNYPPHWAGPVFDKFRFQVQVARPITDALVCCSDYVRGGVIQHFGVEPREAVTVYNGVPVDAVAERAAKARSARTSGPFRVGMVARYEVHKDQPTLIRAVKTLTARGHALELWLVGDGSRRAEYEALLREERLEDRVKLLGTRRDVPELLGQLDAFVFSAKPDEGFGIALVEAMAAGVPVVATDVGACREVLEDGALGLLVPERNVTAMADALLSLKSDPRTAQRARAAAERARAFSVQRMADGYAQVLGG